MIAQLKVMCFGGLRIELNGTLVSNFETDKSRALLVYLALESTRAVRRSHIAGLLWPDESEERALHNLRQTLSSLRKILKESNHQPEYIQADRESIQINPMANVYIECLEFKRIFQNAFQNYQGQNGYGLPHICFLMKAMNIFQGEFLKHFSLNKSMLFDEWVYVKREEFNLMAIRGFTFLSIYHEKRGEYHFAIENLSKIVELFPWDETARNRLIRLLAIDHQWSAAKKHYFALKRYLQEELSVSPSQDSVNLFEQICKSSEGKIVITPEYPLQISQIPVRTTVFVGRQNDLDEVMVWLTAPEKRLVTITGLGGIGKTHFVLEIARKLIGVVPDGVFFVSLISANGADQITNLIAESIGLFFNEQTANQKQLFDHLRNKQLLLILDNFEHLINEEKNLQFIDQLLSNTSILKILVTSREVLNLVQEQVYQLLGLECPPDSNIVVKDVEKYDAIQLFLQRTYQKSPQFILNDKNIESIVRICITLEGLPLGVELAAAVICEDGCDLIAETYEHNLAALTTRMSNFHPRHRSLYAAFEISWELLSPQLQKKLLSLSYFRAGFTKEAALWISASASSDLTILVSKSLLRVDEQGRYSMHEAVRQFVNTKITQAFDFNKLKEKHACYYANFLAEKNQDLLHGGQTVALSSIQTEIGNISLCWIWIIEHNLFNLIHVTMDSLYHYFSIRSLFQEGISWFKRATESVEHATNNYLVLGMLLWRLGSLAYKVREAQLAFDSLTKSEKILSTIHAEDELARCRVVLGWTYHREKDFLKAQRFSDLALQFFLEQDDDLGLTQSYILAGSIENRQGNYKKSLFWCERAYDLCKKTENKQILVTVINFLADIACYEGDYDKAILLYQESLGFSEQLNNLYHQAILLNNLGTIYHIQQNYPKAKKYYERSLAFAREIGDLDGIALALNNLGELSTWLEDYEVALTFSEEALEIARKVMEIWTVIVCLNSLGEIYNGKQDYQKSKTYLVEALKMAIEINGLDLAARVVINLARVYQKIGDQDLAKTLLIAVLSHSATEQDSREKALGRLSEMDVNETYVSNDELLKNVLMEKLFLNQN